MSTSPTEKRSYYYKQNFAFSTNYLDYEIPDFRGIINRTVPLLVLPTGILNVGFQPISASSLHELIQNSLNDEIAIVCNDAVSFHRLALQQAENNEQYRESIWRLTDNHALWDVCLLEQRIVWGTEGRVIGCPSFGDLQNQYGVPADMTPHEALRYVLLSQFDNLIDNLPFLKNDIAGRRIFRENEYDSPYISAPTRVLARDRIHFKERLHVFVPLIEGWLRYGPACIGLDVQGAIAKHYLDRSSPQRLTGSLRRYQEILNRLRDTLRESSDQRNYSDLLHGKIEADGSPAYSSASAQVSIQHHWENAWGVQAYMNSTRPVPNPEDFRENSLVPNPVDPDAEEPHTLPPLGRKEIRSINRSLGYTQDNRFSRRMRRFPLDDNGQISLDPDHWSDLIPSNGPLRLWAKYHAASKTLHFARPSSTFLPHEIFPYLKSCVTEFAEYQNIPLLTPSNPEKRVFLELRIRDLDLLCYFRTHLETDFALESGRENELDALRHATGTTEVAASVPTIWSAEGLAASLDSYEVSDRRVLPTDPIYSRDFWEAARYYGNSRFFERPQQERDLILAAIFGYDPEDRFHDNERWAWYLPEERREELFLAIVRYSVKGLLRGYTSEMVAEQLRSPYGDEIPGTIHGQIFSEEINRLFRHLLNTGRFRGMVGSNLLNAILPRLCLDPVFRPMISAERLSEEIRLDGQWRRDESVRRVVSDPMGRDALGDISDGNIMSGRSAQNRLRWNFLLPLLEERCHELGVSVVVPGEQLVDRLMTTNAISQNGKPSRPVSEWEKPYTCWMETADDAKKAASYALVRNGASLITAVANGFLLEVDVAEAQTLAQRYVGIVKNTVEAAIGIEANFFGNFVEANLSSQWPNSDVTSIEMCVND